MLKNSKKLANKVEILTRKIQSLQTKLLSAKAAQQALKPDVAHLPDSVDPSLDIAVTNPIPTIDLVTEIYLPTPMTSIPPQPTLGPTLLLRAESPENKGPAFQVFKSATPEWHSENSDMATASSVGKKRPVPEDFDHEDIPPQAFTVDSIPRDKVDGQTPRVRRAFGSTHSGFTPVRRRPPPPGASPKRATTTPTITDVTNSPRRPPNSPPKGVKRSWLGKIRGTSTSQSNLPPSNRFKLDDDS